MCFDVHQYPPSAFPASLEEILNEDTSNTDYLRYCNTEVGDIE